MGVDGISTTDHAYRLCCDPNGQTGKGSTVRMHRDAGNSNGSGDAKCTSSFEVDQDYLRKIKKLQTYLDAVNNIVRPGCSPEVLSVALGLVSGLINALSSISPSPKPHSSL